MVKEEETESRAEKVEKQPSKDGSTVPVVQEDTESCRDKVEKPSKDGSIVPVVKEEETEKVEEKRSKLEILRKRFR